MGSFSDDETPGDHRTAARAKLSDAERAFVLASVAWGDRGRRAEHAGEMARDFLSGFRDRLAPAWFRTLSAGLDHDRSLAESSGRAQALDELQNMHRATACVDLGRVHPSWWIRALREESPAVQRVVAVSIGGVRRDRVQAGLLLDSQDLVSERAANPEVASWVMALWSERLVGGEAERADDSPALIVLGRLSPRSGYRLCWMAGLCKMVLAGQPAEGHASANAQERRRWLADQLADADSELRTLARGEVETSQSSRLRPRQQAARLGLVTIARLLADSEPFRLRWALQHWPYPFAKVIRSLMAPATSRPASLWECETLILKTAWGRLNLEGRLAEAWPESCPPKRGESTTV